MPLLTCSEVRFTYDLISLDSFDEGLEMSFSYLNSNRRGAWIPIWYYSSHEPEDKGRSVDHEDTITLGNITDGQITLRGYTVNFTVAENMTDNEAMIRLCGANVFGRDTEDKLFKWRFRWLQTAAQDDSNDTDGDVIRIYNIHIQAVLNGTTDSEIPLFDNTTRYSFKLHCYISYYSSVTNTVSKSNAFFINFIIQSLSSEEME